MKIILKRVEDTAKYAKFVAEVAPRGEAPRAFGTVYIPLPVDDSVTEVEATATEV